jgi:hypothetical protein
LERDLIHRGLHELDATSVLHLKVVDSPEIRNGVRIKPLALV